MIKIASDLRSLDMNNFRAHVLPCDLADIDGISYVVVRQEELDQLLVDFFDAEISGVTKTPKDQRGNGTEGNGLQIQGDEEYADDVSEEYYYEDDTVYYEEEYYEETEDVYSGTDVYYDEDGNVYTGE